MKYKQFIASCLLIVVCCTPSLFAGTIFILPKNPWFLVANLGYGQFRHSFKNNGQTAIERLAIAKDLVTWCDFPIGAEVGVQTGNRMRLEIDQESLDLLGSLPIETTVKPFIDFLAVLKTPFIFNMPLFITAKGGGAYRQWQIDRDSVNDKDQLAGEIQVGLGYYISNRTSLNLFYQGIFSGMPSFEVDPTTAVGYVANIPAQHSLLLSLSIIV